jgi:threonine dehydrogenase-like Zn-dependent dehydrogenase
VTATVRAVRSTGGAVTVDQVALSGPEDWPVVHVAAAGICGSDLHLVSAGPTAVTLGHEFSGRLDDGTAVAVLPLLACGRCAACAAGEPQRCGGGSELFGITLDGGMADRVRVHPSCVRPIGSGVDIVDACLAEPLAVAVHGVHRAGVSAGHRVLVVGAGAIGLSAVAAAQAAGADVEVTELHGARRARAATLGAREADRPAPGAPGRFDVVLDAAGTQGSLDLAISRSRPGGTIGLLACHWTPVSLGLDLQLKEVSLVPAYLYGHHRGRVEFEEALDLLARPEIADALVSHRLPLDRAAEAFELAATQEALKVVLVP